MEESNLFITILPPLEHLFINDKVRDEWLQGLHNKNLIIERGVNLSEFEKVGVSQIISSRNWWPLMCLENVKVYPNLARLFIANIFERGYFHSCFTTMMKGKKFEITPKVVSLALGIPLVKKNTVLPMCSFTPEDCVIIYRRLSGGSNISGNSTLTPKSLTPSLKMIYMIARTNLFPTTASVETIEPEMALFLYMIALKKPFCICTYIVGCLSRPNVSIPFCRVITLILKYFGVELYEYEENRYAYEPVITSKAFQKEDESFPADKEEEEILSVNLDSDEESGDTP